MHGPPVLCLFDVDILNVIALHSMALRMAKEAPVLIGLKGDPS